MEKKKEIPQQKLKVPAHNLVNDGKYFNEHIRFHGKQGHGFAAERANNQIDRLKMRNAEVLDENIRNGPDRIVNGTLIQTKYCKTAQQAVQNCFSKNEFRYKGQQIEVPPEQYDQVKAIFRQKGYPDVEVRKGHVSYKTAKAIARSGTIEGLTYDAVQGVQLGMMAFGLSAVCAYSMSIWSGKNAKEALVECVSTSAQIFGFNVVSHIVSQQFARSSLNGFAHSETLNLLKQLMKPSDFAAYANSFRTEAQRKIFGAAAQQNAAKIVKGQAVFAAGILVLQTGWDFASVLSGKISGKQLAKNLFCNTAAAGGGIAGAVYGTIIGGPIGGIIGGIFGGLVSQFSAKKIADAITPDDLEEMSDLLKSILGELQVKFMLFNEEMEEVIENLHKNLLNQQFLETMFQKQSERKKFTKSSIKPYFEAALSKRRHITLNSLGSQ